MARAPDPRIDEAKAMYLKGVKLVEIAQTDEEQILKVLCLLLAVPAKVLCEKFRWKPIEDENDRRSRLLQFSEAVVKEVNQTFANDNVDIRAIGEEVYEKYGVRFEVR